MTGADRTAIGIVIDRFVKAVVQRHDLAAGWELAGPGLRGGTTRSSWIRGTGVTVAAFPARGSDFRTAWTGQLVSPERAELSVVLHPRPGSKGEVDSAFAVDLRKSHGRWLVNSFYLAATFGKNGVTGSNDFRVFRFDRDLAAPNPTGTRRDVLFALGALGAAVLLLPLAIWVQLKRRDRRAIRAYTEHLG